jgi:hypothetical protein
MAFTTITRRKSEQSADPRSRQIDELQRISVERRNQFLGPDWYRTCRILYNLLQGSASRPSFRPAVLIPQMQLLAFSEATDLSSLSPKVYITKKRERDAEREKAFQDDWRAQSINNRLLFAELWALYAGTSFLQVGYDPNARQGDGEVWTDWVDPETVYPDPSARSDRDWTYVILESRLYADEVKALWPETATGIQPRRASGSPTLVNVGESAGYSFEMPPGPLSAMPGSPASRQAWDGRLKVRVLFTDDYSLLEVKEKAIDKALNALASTQAAVKPKHLRKYPNGRFIVECEGRILADGDNPFPRTDRVKFPVIPLWALPNLTSFWAPPPPRFSLDLQELAGRMYSQAFENAVRLNNGIWFIDEATGIEAEDFGGLPGEVRIINAQSRIPEIRWPAPMPEHMLKMPAILLALQKELWGFTQVREGQPGKGNVSAGLFDASLYQSQFLTRLRSMLLAEAVQKLAEIRFFSMCRFYRNSRYFPSFNPTSEEEDKAFSFSEWKPLDASADMQIHLDPGSVRPISQAAMRQLVMGLRSAGLIDAPSALEILEIPDAEAIAEKVEKEQQLAALARTKKR